MTGSRPPSGSIRHGFQLELAGRVARQGHAEHLTVNVKEIARMTPASPACGKGHRLLGVYGDPGSQSDSYGASAWKSALLGSSILFGGPPTLTIGQDSPDFSFSRK